MTTWFTSDHHFGHANIIKYENRPSNWQDIAISRWNEVVKDKDIVIHLGDFSFYPVDMTAAILKELKGRKFILLGNHDGSRTRMKKAGFEEAWGSRKYADYGENQFWKRYTVTLADDRNVVFALSHAPLSKLKGFARFNVHGHIHSNPYPVDMMGGQRHWHYNAGVEVNDYYPVSAEQVYQRRCY